MPINANRSIIEIPVTRSGLTIGSCVIDSTTARGRFFMECRPIAVAVPITVARMLEITATSSVVSNASITSPSEKSAVYAPNENPFHIAAERESVNDITSITAMGRYINSTTMPRYAPFKNLPNFFTRGFLLPCLRLCPLCAL